MSIFSSEWDQGMEYDAGIPVEAVGDDKGPKPYHGMMKPYAPTVPRQSAKTVKDMVNLPHHYARFAIEPIRFLVENKLDPLRFNAIKYIMRCDAKNGLEDLRKAHRCLDMFAAYHFDKEGAYHEDGPQDPDWWRVGRGAER
jgi:hypothetical protein